MKNSVLAGFHAVGARLRMDPKSISAVYLDPERRDKRMRDMREKLIAAGVRVMNADQRRLDGMAPDVPHQGIVALAEEKQAMLEFDELLDQITDKTLILILDGVTDPRNFGACLRAADCAGVQCVSAWAPCSISRGRNWEIRRPIGRIAVWRVCAQWDFTRRRWR